MRVAGLGVVLMCATVTVAAQHESALPAGPALVPLSLTGSTSFDLYCASCHGRGGTGDGPLASALRIHPSDLTRLAARNKGVFPRAEVRAFVEGTTRRPPAHGSSEMPVWGPVFRGLELSDARVRVRLDNLVAFIESIQGLGGSTPVTSRVPDGASLFQSYCASCHGPNGRGDGPLVGQLRQRPADLTTYTKRNGGIFPEAKVTRIIDGRDVPAHGDGTMPVWGNVFHRSGDMSAPEVRARISAITQFLASIQERPAE